MLLNSVSWGYIKMQILSLWVHVEPEILHL